MQWLRENAHEFKPMLLWVVVFFIFHEAEIADHRLQPVGVIIADVVESFQSG